MSHWEKSGKSNDWYTPKHVFDALSCHFDLDVAAPSDGPMHVPCDGWLYNRSLERHWSGFVWMNPPFGGRNGIVPWLNKFFQHGNGIALTPDRTSAPWFRDAWAKTEMALFTPKVKFIRPDGSEGKGPSNGTCLFAVGPTGRKALRHAAAAGLGILARPEGTEQ